MSRCLSPPRKTGETQSKDFAGDTQRAHTASPFSSEPAEFELKTSTGYRAKRDELIERLKHAEGPLSYVKNSQCVVTATLAKYGRSTQSNFVQGLLPPASMSKDPEYHTRRIGLENTYDTGIAPERPRSALHSGDFWQEQDDMGDSKIHDFSSLADGSCQDDIFSTCLGARSPGHLSRSRSRSASRYTHLVRLAPTSPLIHASSNQDLDRLSERQRSPSSSTWRRTFSPHSFQSIRSSPRRQPGYQAHQPRRSISIPHTPLIRPRGFSNSSEVSPLHHAPLVGSYEESILRGRMSTTPSLPLDFIAQIGVLGKGKCKPSLRCPAHVTVTFPAVFYSYSCVARPMDNSPSPYVGLIDIENTFPSCGKISSLGGCYRIPQQGQLQIVIKNPNKTAVKLFLVPYDLSDMEPGQKTFIRQRSYSAGPIIDMPVSSRCNYGTDRPEAAISHSEDPLDRPTLRYLVHINICCPAKGRFFLYQSIRVVFANRVPDGKEKLRNEIQYPEPKYSPYRLAQKVSAKIATREISTQRISTPLAFSMLNLDEVDGMKRESFPSINSRHGTRLDLAESIRPVPLAFLETATSRPTSCEDQMDVLMNLPRGHPRDVTVVRESFETWLNRRWNS